jgi:hypothetical protein
MRLEVGGFDGTFKAFNRHSRRLYFDEAVHRGFLTGRIAGKFTYDRGSHKLEEIQRQKKDQKLCIWDLNNSKAQLVFCSTPCGRPVGRVGVVEITSLVRSRMHALRFQQRFTFHY